MNITPATLAALANGDIENAITASLPGGIEAQEAQGQQDFVTSQTLPKDCPQAELEKLGFVFGEEADDIFVNVLFPEGWVVKATDHSMHNDLIDDKGRKRGGIFYKAAFYDCHADLHLSVRYTARQNYELADENIVQYQVFDCETPIFKTDQVSAERGGDKYWDAQGRSSIKAQEFLEKEFPNYRDPTAYWD